MAVLIVLFLVIATVAIGIIAFAMNRVSAPAWPRMSGGRLGTRPGSDGFYVVGSAPIGTIVEYRALVGGAWRTGSIGITGGDTFVYLGMAPSEVQIWMSGEGGGVSMVEVDSVDYGSSSGPDDNAGPGFPSAY